MYILYNSTVLYSRLYSNCSLYCIFYFMYITVLYSVHVIGYNITEADQWSWMTEIEL